MRHFNFVLALCVSLGANMAAAQALETRLSTGTSNAEHQVLSLNPAVPQTNKLKFGYAQAVVNRDIDVTHVNLITGNTDIDIKADEIYHGLGFSIPLGGAAFAMTGQMHNKEVATLTTDSTDPDHETFVTKEGAARIAFDLMPTLRMALAYRIVKQETDILGGYFVNDSDRTNYAASLNGYVVGVFYENQNSGFGASYNPPIRGKAKVEGEQKIVTETGLMTIDGFLANGNMKFGVAMKRWIYQADDRSTPSTSPVNLTQMSLNGMDLEQFYKPKEQVTLGLDYPLAQSFSIGFNMYRTNAVFLYTYDSIPGDEPTRERAMHSFGGKLAFGYANNDIDVRVGIDYSQRKRGEVQDNAGWYGYGNYNNYKTTDQAIYTAVNLSR